MAPSPVEPFEGEDATAPHSTQVIPQRCDQRTDCRGALAQAVGRRRQVLRTGAERQEAVRACEDLAMGHSQEIEVEAQRNGRDPLISLDRAQARPTAEWRESAAAAGYEGVVGDKACLERSQGT